MAPLTFVCVCVRVCVWCVVCAGVTVRVCVGMGMVVEVGVVCVRVHVCQGKCLSPPSEKTYIP